MESALVRRVKELDDHGAFEQLVLNHQLAIRKFLLRITHSNNELAQDLAQETFIAAYKNIASYRGEGKFISWLFGIAHQAFILHLRKHKHQLEPLENWDIAAPDTNKDIENKQFLLQMFNVLNPQELVAVTLYYQQQFSIQEVSEIMTVPINTVKTIVRRSRIKLQEQVKENQ